MATPFIVCSSKVSWLDHNIVQVTCFPATCDLLCEVQLVAVARWKTAHTTLNTNLIWPPLCICIESKRWFHSTFWLCFAFYYILSNTLNGQPLWLAYLGLFTIPKMERKKTCSVLLCSCRWTNRPANISILSLRLWDTVVFRAQNTIAHGAHLYPITAIQKMEQGREAPRVYTQPEGL